MRGYGPKGFSLRLGKIPIKDSILRHSFDCVKGNFLLSAMNAVGRCLGKPKTFSSDETEFTYADRASTAVISRACARGSVFAVHVPISQEKAKKNT